MRNNHGATRRREPPMSLEVIGLLEHRRCEFERKFKRPPRPGEPLFFDPEADEPRRLPDSRIADAGQMVTALTGLPPKVAAGLVIRW